MTLTQGLGLGASAAAVLAVLWGIFSFSDSIAENAEDANRKARAAVKSTREQQRILSEHVDSAAKAFDLQQRQAEELAEDVEDLSDDVEGPDRGMRSSAPSECYDPPQGEWVYRHPSGTTLDWRCDRYLPRYEDRRPPPGYPYDSRSAR